MTEILRSARISVTYCFVENFFVLKQIMHQLLTGIFADVAFASKSYKNHLYKLTQKRKQLKLLIRDWIPAF